MLKAASNRMKVVHNKTASRQQLNSIQQQDIQAGWYDPYPHDFSGMAGGEEREELQGPNRGGHCETDPRDGVGGHSRAYFISHTAAILPACRQMNPLQLCATLHVLVRGRGGEGEGPERHRARVCACRWGCLASVANCANRVCMLLQDKAHIPLLEMHSGQSDQESVRGLKRAPVWLEIASRCSNLLHALQSVKAP